MHACWSWRRPLWAAAGRKKASPYGEDGKLRKDVTLEEIRGIDHAYGDLIGLSYFHGGVMEGSSHDVMLTKDRGGFCCITTRDAGSVTFPRIIRIYRADGSVFSDLQALIGKDNLALWADLPFEDEFMVMDAPSTSINLYYDDSAQEGRSYASYTIRYANVMPEGASDILREFTRAMFSAISPENMTDAYFEIGGEAVRPGRDQSLTDDQISALMGGYWKEIKKEDGTENAAEDGITIYSWGLGDNLEYSQAEDGTYTEKVLTVGKIVHSPWKDADSSFYITLEDQKGDAYVLYIEGMTLVLEREDGSGRRELERQD